MGRRHPAFVSTEALGDHPLRRADRVHSLGQPAATHSALREAPIIQFGVADAAKTRHYALVLLNAEGAAAAAASVFPDLQVRRVATRIGGTDLSSVGFYEDGIDMPLAGASVLVGPDQRVWVFSSNPAIHDPRVVVSVLSGIYREGVAAAVDQEPLADAIRAATEALAAQCARSLRQRPQGNSGTGHAGPCRRCP